MSERADFLREVGRIAAGQDSEDGMKNSAKLLFEEYVRRATDFYKGQSRARDRVRSDVSKLRDLLAGETNQGHPGRPGMLIDFTYDLVARWLNPGRKG
jgi:hypothetical protein